MLPLSKTVVSRFFLHRIGFQFTIFFLLLILASLIAVFEAASLGQPMMTNAFCLGQGRSCNRTGQSCCSGLFCDALYGSSVVGAGGIAMINCCQGIDEGRQTGHLKPAKVILMSVLLINIGLLAYASLGGILETEYLKVGRIVCIGGALLELVFLITFFYLDSLLLVAVYAFLVVLSTIGITIATLHLQYPGLWLEVIICALMGVCSLLLMLDYVADERERQREKELRQRRRSSSSSSAPMKV